MPSPLRPTTDVCISYLTGEQADAVASGLDYDWLARASEDFDAYVDERRRVRPRWGIRARSTGTCPGRTNPDNEASRKVIATNGWHPDVTLGHDLRFWIDARRSP
jgi:hypothetical protein